MMGRMRKEITDSHDDHRAFPQEKFDKREIDLKFPIWLHYNLKNL
jgi:hypothetical protein